MTDLTTLATECEGAEGPTYDLESRIYKAVNPEGYQRRLTALLAGPMGPRLHPVDYDGYIKPPAYTASLDAALLLVPEGCNWQVSTEEPGPWAWVGEPGSDIPAIMCATPALALTAACLRAMAG